MVLKIIFLFYSLFFLTFRHVFAEELCHIQTPKKVYYFGGEGIKENSKKIKFLDFGKCPKEIIQNLEKKLLTKHGDVFLNSLKSELLDEGMSQKDNLNFQMETIKVLDLRKIIKSKFFPDKDLKIEFLNRPDRVITATNDFFELEIECIDCSSQNKGSVVLKIRNQNLIPENENILLSFLVLKKRKILKIKKNVEDVYQEKITPEDFEKVSGYFPSRNYFKDLSLVSYYRLNRTMLEGEILLKTNLTPIPLIKRGQRVSLYAQGKGFQIKLKGEAIETGFYGKDIKILLKNKKIIKARVKDFDTLIYKAI